MINIYNIIIITFFLDSTDHFWKKKRRKMRNCGKKLCLPDVINLNTLNFLKTCNFYSKNHADCRGMLTFTKPTTETVSNYVVWNFIENLK